MSKTLPIVPVLSEKTYSQSESHVFAVKVPGNANKNMVKEAIEAQYNVVVGKVNILNQEGKAKRTISLTGKRSTNRPGKRSDYKKAYVTLKEGSLPFFKAIEEAEEKREANQARIDKAVEKQSAKSEKKEKRSFRKKKAEDK